MQPKIPRSHKELQLPPNTPILRPPAFDTQERTPSPPPSKMEVKLFPALGSYYATAARDANIVMLTPLHKNPCTLHTKVVELLYRRHKVNIPPLFAKKIKGNAIQYIHVMQVYNELSFKWHKANALQGLFPKAPVDDCEFFPQPPTPQEEDETPHDDPMDIDIPVNVSIPGVINIPLVRFTDTRREEFPTVQQDKCRYCSFTSTYGICYDCKRHVAAIKALPIYSPSLKMDMGMLARIYQRRGESAVLDTLNRAFERHKQTLAPKPPKQPNRDFSLTSDVFDPHRAPSLSKKKERSLERAIKRAEEKKFDFIPFKVPTPKTTTKPWTSVNTRPRVPDPALDPLSDQVMDAWKALDELAQTHPELHTQEIAPITKAALDEIQKNLTEFATKQGDNLTTRVTTFFGSIWTYLKESGAILPIILLLLDIALIALIWWISTFEITTLPGFFFKISVLSILTGITAGMFVFTASAAHDLIFTVKQITIIAPEFKRQREEIARSEGAKLEELFPDHDKETQMAERPPRPEPSRLNNEDPIGQLNEEAFNLCKYSLPSAEREFKRMYTAVVIAHHWFRVHKASSLSRQLYTDVIYMSLRSLNIRIKYKDNFTNEFKTLAVWCYQQIVEHAPEMLVPNGDTPARLPKEYIEENPHLLVGDVRNVIPDIRPSEIHVVDTAPKGKERESPKITPSQSSSKELEQRPPLVSPPTTPRDAKVLYEEEDDLPNLHDSSDDEGYPNIAAVPRKKTPYPHKKRKRTSQPKPMPNAKIGEEDSYSIDPDDDLDSLEPFSFDIPKKHNGPGTPPDHFSGIRNTISTTLSKAVDEVGKAAVGIVDDVAALGLRDATKGLHMVATTIRDAKSLFDIFTPLVTSVVAFVYEKATGKIFVTGAEKIYHDKLIPMMEKISQLEARPNFNGEIITSPDFRLKVQSVVNEYETLRNTFFKTAPDRLNTLFLSRLPTINDWKLKIYEGQCSGKSRPTPVMIELVGLPASGKSTLAKLLFQAFHKLERDANPDLPEWNQGLLYDRKVANEYWDGYNENPYIIMDDIFQALDVDVRFTQAMEVIQLINTAPFQLHMSGVNDKSNHFALPRLVVTTRNGDLSPSRLNIADPQAYYRRRTFLVLVVPNLQYSGAQPWDPDYLKFWKLLLHDPFGNFVMEVTPEMLAKMAHAKWTENVRADKSPEPTLVPTKSQVTEHELSAAMIALQHSTQASLYDLHNPNETGEDIYEQETPEDEAQDEDEPHRKQGNFIRTNDEVEMLNFIEQQEARTEPYIYINKSEQRPIWEAIAKRVNIPRLRAKLKNTEARLKLTRIEAAEWLEQARAKIGTTLVQKWTASKQWTVKKFNDIVRVVKAVPTLLKILAIGASAYLKEMVINFALNVADYIKENKWKVIFGLLGLAAAIGGAVALATYFSRKDSPDYQSRSEDKREEKKNKDLERRKEEEQARREQRIEAALRGGKHNIPAWKAFDESVEAKLRTKQAQVIDADLVTKQYASTDVPFLNVYFKNTYNMNYCDTAGQNHGRGQILFFSGRVGLTAAHIIQELKKNAAGGQVWLTKDQHTFRCFIRDLQFDFLPNTEAGVVKFPVQCPQHHSIISHFPKESEITSPDLQEISEVNVLARLDNGAHLVRELGIATLDCLNPFKHTHPTDPVLPYWTCPSGKTVDGDSGGTWYTSNTRLRFRILGIHSGGGKRTAFASPITQEMITPYAEMSPGISTPPVDAVNFQPPEVAPGYLPEATVKQGASLPPRNDIVPSVVALELYEMGWKTTTLPSVVKPIIPFQHAEHWRDRGVVFDGEFSSNEKISPLEVIKTKLSFESKLFPFTTLPSIAPNYYMDWPRPHGHYNIYHPHEIIYGLPALGVDHIRMDASPGYPYTVTNGMKTRKQIFGENSTQIKTEFTEALTRIRDENRGEGQYMPIYTLSIKVERRPVPKVFEANSRSIFGGPVDFQVMGQMFYYDLMQACIAHCTSRITIGIDPHSKDWKVLYQRLRRHPNLMETDAKRWDNSQEIVVPTFFIDQFIAYLNSLNVRNRTRGFITKEELLKQARKVTIGCLQAYVIMMNTLYSVYLQIKSGNFITTLFNCFLNDLRWFVVYVTAAFEYQVVTNNILKHYRDNVEGAFHGDDSLLSASDAVAPWFNAISARYYWKEIFNIELTPAGVNKDNEFTPFVAWEAARFLKRGFAPEDDGHVYAPLEPTVITDMVLWSTDVNQNVKITKHNIAAALMEAAHHSEEFFNKLEADLKKAAIAKNIEWVASTYKQYRQMFRRVTPPTVDFKSYAREVALGEATI